MGISLFATNEEALTARCIQLEAELKKYRDVAVAADQVYDFVSEHSLEELKKALDKVKL